MRGKVMAAAQAIETFLSEGCGLLGIGGLFMYNSPMALVREICRQQRRVKRLLGGVGGCIASDLLIGAGLVNEILNSYTGFDSLGMAPQFRKAVEEGRLRVLEIEEAFVVHSLYAGAAGLPFVPYPRGLENTDIPRVNPELYRTTIDPYDGSQVLTVPPTRPDVALVHCQEADERGNAVFLGSPFTDRLMAMAARKLILQVERIVDTQKISSSPPGTTIPAFYVHAVVEVPGGCHPTASHTCYRPDEDHLRAYIKAARTVETFNEYLKTYVTGTADDTAYLALVGEQRLEGLRRGVYHRE